MKLYCDKKYIVLPVSHQAENKSLKFFENGRLIYELKIGLDFVNPDVEFYLNIERFAGKELEIAVKPYLPLKIKKSDSKYPSEECYIGEYRPGFHFTAQRGWLNDPNGLVYYKGMYHMFYQHNPVGCKWGNMHWGHAVSRDLVHWEEKEIALYPDEMGTMFSGSAIVDAKNATGLKQNENDVILLYYTAAGGTDSELSKSQPFTQCLAYSVDGGHTFEKYHGNPVLQWIEHENRDPKVVYDPVNNIYIMALYLSGNRFMLLTSSNLLEWRQAHEIILHEDAECPDFYPLPADDDENNIKWVFSGASDRYLIGRFDGQKFSPETEVRKLQYSKDSYAAQTWSGIPQKDERRIRIAWNRIDNPNMPFNMSMNFPCEMKLKTFGGEIFLCAYPVREIESLHGERINIQDIKVTPGHKYCRMLTEKLYDITFNIFCASKSRFVISLFGLEIYGDLDNKQLVCLENTAPFEQFEEIIELRMLVDINSIEIFINKGKAFISMGHIQDYNFNRLEVEAYNSEILIKDIKIAVLNNIWRAQGETLNKQ